MRRFEDDIEVVLKRYGLFIDRTWLSVEKIPKADEAILTARRRIEAAIAVEQARGLSTGERLVGLKALEVRGLIDEVITTRTEYGDHSLCHHDFRHEHPTRRLKVTIVFPKGRRCREVMLLEHSPASRPSAPGGLPKTQGTPGSGSYSLGRLSKI
jgi:hypothetical protein